MKSMIDNWINGNLSTARKQAKNKPGLKIRAYLIETGYSPKKATLAATWLKTGEGFQALCDCDD